MLADRFCWSALAVDGETVQAVITVSTVLYVEWGRLGEIGDLYVHPEHRRKGLARRLVEHAKAWCRTQGCHHASRRAAAWARSILRQARLRAVRSNERFSRRWTLDGLAHLLGPCGMVHGRPLTQGITSNRIALPAP
jgi:GNAT superfamily N-acetyltransferase